MMQLGEKYRCPTIAGAKLDVSWNSIAGNFNHEALTGAGACRPAEPLIAT
jgi:hypothetical protein